jgi:hypothetical protein
MKIARFFYLSLPLILIFAGCKKEKDTTKPVITFSSPSENQTFNVFDVVNVVASVSDETELTEVNISLVDGARNQKHTLLQLGVSSNSLSVNEDYWLNNIHLESGFYDIQIAASDGENITKAYRRINIIAVPKVIERIFVGTYQSSASSQIYEIDSTFSSMFPFTTFNGDLSAMQASSYYQQLNMMGRYNGSITGIKLEDNSVRFAYPAVTSVDPYFTGFMADEQNMYVAKYNGEIKGYSNYGAQIYTAAASAGYYPEEMLHNAGYIFSEQKYRTSSSRLLMTYLNTGAALQQKTISQDVKIMLPRNDNEVFLFGNVAGQGVLQLYERAANHIWSPYPYPLPAGELLSAVRLDEDNYLIGMSDGTIYQYNYVSSSITSLLPGYTAKKMLIEPLHNVLYVVEENSVSTFSIPSFSPLQSVSSPAPVIDIAILYNR